MIASFIITFRETLEAALIAGIVFGYLKKTNQQSYNKIVWIGIITGIISSVTLGIILNTLMGGFANENQERIFEGITTLIGAFFITMMIYWMKNQKNIADELSNKIDNKIQSSSSNGIFFLIFFSILREGVETVLFLAAISSQEESYAGIGAFLGIFIALLIGLGIFRGSIKINLKRFFNITSILLLLIAAGLIAYGIHELQDAGLITTIIYPIWDLKLSFGDIFDDKGIFGSILKGLFGYNHNPSLIEFIAYLTYLAINIIIWKNIGQKTGKKVKINASEKEIG